MHTTPTYATPLSPQSFYILLALCEKPSHGYALMAQVAADSAGSVVMPSGTMYTALARLAKGRLIEETPAYHPAAPGKERHYYQITKLGKLCFEQEVNRLKRAAIVGRQQLHCPTAWRVI